MIMLECHCTPHVYSTSVCSEWTVAGVPAKGDFQDTYTQIKQQLFNCSCLQAVVTASVKKNYVF